MDQSTEKRLRRLQRDLVRDKQSLTDSIDRLKLVARERVTLGHWVAASPYRWLLGGCVAGFLVGLRRTGFP